MVSIRDFFQKCKKNLILKTLLFYFYFIFKPIAFNKKQLFFMQRST